MPEGKSNFSQHILQKSRVRTALAQIDAYPDGGRP